MSAPGVVLVHDRAAPPPGLDHAEELDMAGFVVETVGTTGPGGARVTGADVAAAADRLRAAGAVAVGVVGLGAGAGAALRAARDGAVDAVVAHDLGDGTRGNLGDLLADAARTTCPVQVHVAEGAADGTGLAGYAAALAALAAAGTPVDAFAYARGATAPEAALARTIGFLHARLGDR